MQIDVRIETGKQKDAGTDGGVYLGICGREFLLDNIGEPGADFERKLDQTFTLGENATVVNPEDNDPRQPQPLDTADLPRYPIWIRFQPVSGEDNWNASEVQVTVNPGSQGEARYKAPHRGDLWLGEESGEYWFLLETSR